MNTARTKTIHLNSKLMCKYHCNENSIPQLHIENYTLIEFIIYDFIHLCTNCTHMPYDVLRDISIYIVDDEDDDVKSHNMFGSIT